MNTCQDEIDSAMLFTLPVPPPFLVYWGGGLPRDYLVYEMGLGTPFARIQRRRTGVLKMAQTKAGIWLACWYRFARQRVLVCGSGTMRGMRGADTGCRAMHYHSLSLEGEGGAPPGRTQRTCAGVLTMAYDQARTWSLVPTRSTVVVGVWKCRGGHLVGELSARVQAY